MPMKQILKYPRTLHLRGSTLQQGDDPDQVSMASLKGKGNFVFEKADGANAGLSFDPDDGTWYCSRVAIRSTAAAANLSSTSSSRGRRPSSGTSGLFSPRYGRDVALR
jgi:hypothetical protein